MQTKFPSSRLDRIKGEGTGLGGYGVEGKNKQSQDRQEGNRKGLSIGGWGLKDLMISALSASDDFEGSVSGT